MKKLLSLFVCFGLLCAFCCFPILAGTQKIAKANTQQPYSVSLLPTDLSASAGVYGIDSFEVKNFTPMESYLTGKRYAGSSWNPATKTINAGGDNEVTYVSDSIDISSSISTVDFGEITDVDDLNLVMWVYIDQPVAKAMTIRLSDGTDSVYAEWSLSSGDIETLLSKGEQMSKMDIRICGEQSKVPYGWNKIVLPIKTATKVGNIYNDASAPTAFVVDTLSVEQSAVSGVSNELYLFDIQLVETVYAGVCAIEKQDYTAIKFEDAENFFNEDAYYKGEYFDAFPSVAEFFAYCWIGEENYLAKSASELRTYFVVQVSNDSTGEIKDYHYGTNDFKLEASSYTLHFSMYYFGSGTKRTIGFDSFSFDVSSYGEGAYFTTNSIKVEEGKKFKIHYTVHSAFTETDFALKIEAVDGECIKIVEWNKDERYIVVEGLKEGKSAIRITLNSDRLNNTDYTEGITNESCVVTVTEPSSELQTTRVLLWICLGLILATAIYVVVKSIIESRKISVK